MLESDCVAKNIVYSELNGKGLFEDYVEELLTKVKFETVWLIEIVWMSSLLCMVVRVMIFETLMAWIDKFKIVQLACTTIYLLELIISPVIL